MRKSIVFALLLLVAAKGLCTDYYLAYAPELLKVQPQFEGPWKYNYVRCGLFQEWYDFQHFEKVSYNSLNDQTFYESYHLFKKTKPPVYQWHDKDGIGFTFHQDCDPDYFTVVFSSYKHEELVPPYTRIRLRWNYSVAGQSNDFLQNVALYAYDGTYADLRNINFDILPDATNRSGAQYLLSNVISDDEQTKRVEGNASFDFNNLKGGETLSKTWYLMLTLSYFTTRDEEDVHQWGGFRSEAEAWDTTYYKIASFDANGGNGYMQELSFETSDVVPANAFIREGYTFQGWATSSTGIVRYIPGDEITATKDSKGPVTLYAVWKPQIATIIALIDAIGEVAYSDDCFNKIDAARKAYDELSAAEKEQVTNYSTLEAAETLYNTVDAVVKKIDAIGTVQYSDESRELIDDAQTAYDALNAEAKALVINYSQLSAAQGLYDALKVVEKIDAIGDVVYTAECKALINAARTAYDALSAEPKTQVSNYATLLAAETAYAAFGKKTVLFVNQTATDTISSQLKAIVYPELPQGATNWQTVEKNVSLDKTIVIKAE